MTLAIAGRAAGLACRQRELDGRPKYLYGSAGGATRCRPTCTSSPAGWPGCRAGPTTTTRAGTGWLQLGPAGALDPDAYDYFVNRPVFEAGAFALFLVAELAAIEPLYGSEAASASARSRPARWRSCSPWPPPEHGLGLCGIGSVEPAELDPLLDLGPTHRLIYSMVGGLRPDAGPEHRGTAEPAEPASEQVEDRSGLRLTEIELDGVAMEQVEL